MLLYATFAIGKCTVRQAVQPQFLLSPDELLARLDADENARWHVQAFEDDYLAQPKPTMVQRDWRSQGPRYIGCRCADQLTNLVCIGAD